MVLVPASILRSNVLKKIAMTLMKNTLDKTSFSRDTKWEDPSMDINDFEERKSGDFCEDKRTILNVKNRLTTLSATKKVIFAKNCSQVINK